VTGRDLGTRPTMRDLPIGKLGVDAKYQRDTSSRRSQNLIEKIAAGFRWERFGAVLTVCQGDVWHVIDGQHRVEAARRIGVDSVPAIVLPHATVAEAAADFVAINRDRVAVTPLHIHHAQLAAGDPEAQTIERVCKASDVEICRYPVPSNKMKPGQTLAVQSIARLVKLGGEEWAVRVMKRVRREGGAAPGAVNAVAIRDAAAHLFGYARPDESTASARGRRSCLSCRAIFESAGKHNRLCPKCKGQSE
jgi:hypothetical protein